VTLLDEVTYNPASGQTINLFANSQAFSNAIWVTTQATKTSTSVQSPIGTLDAVLITEANDLGVPSSHGLRYQPYNSWVAGQQYTYSVFAKAGIASAGIALVLQAGVFTDGIERNANYNFSTVSTTKNTTASMGTSIVDLNNGWYRCSLSFTTTNVATVGLQMRIFNGSGSFYASTGTGTVYLWGVQLEKGSTATTYVATTSTAGLPFTPYNGVQKITRNGEIYVSGIFDEVTGIL
jgi:hypothetical protein